jgi:S1-C subfamily serine protease
VAPTYVLPTYATPAPQAGFDGSSFAPPAQAYADPRHAVWQRLGLAVEQVPTLVVMQVGPAGMGRAMGAKVGDRIAAVNAEPVRTIHELDAALAASGASRPALTIIRSGRVMLLDAARA